MFIAILMIMPTLSGCLSVKEDNMEETNGIFSFEEGEIPITTWYHYPGGIDAMNNTSAFGGTNTPFSSSGIFHFIQLGLIMELVGIHLSRH